MCTVIYREQHWGLRVKWLSQERHLYFHWVLANGFILFWRRETDKTNVSEHRDRDWPEGFPNTFFLSFLCFVFLRPQVGRIELLKLFSPWSIINISPCKVLLSFMLFPLHLLYHFLPLCALRLSVLNLFLQSVFPMFI